ncbi:MAG: hypothetical protein KDE46_15355, partial [Caldilineaceae bacterium]|nr:hypothetical protein [Caldilineaceae bacterium]
AQLAGSGRIVQMEIPTAAGSQTRWVDAELAGEYAAAFALDPEGAPRTEQGIPRGAWNEQSSPLTGEAGKRLTSDEARRQILNRYLSQVGPVTVQAIRVRYDFPAEWLAAELQRQVEARQLVHGRFTPTPEKDATEKGVEIATPPTAEYVDRRTLEQMHRRTLTILRKEVQPAPLTAYADFLARWQHLHPAARLEGEASLRQVLQQLRAAPVVGRVWERDVLPLRLQNYQAGDLADLCQSGELVWVGAGGVDPRRMRVRYFFRGEGSAYLEPPPMDVSALSQHAQNVYAFLKGEGALFLADICTALELDRADAEAALTELVMAGLVTNDSLDALRRIVGGEVATPTAQHARQRPLSTLETQLAERLATRRGTQPARLGEHPPLRPGGIQRPSRHDLRAARQRVRQRLGQEQEATVRAASEGRWAPVHRFGVLGKQLPPGEQAAIQARQLLARHGVVTRESLAGEFGAWVWYPVYQELQRLEMRGEVRRGIFVQGMPGLQFALPEVVEQLRDAASTYADSAYVDDALVLLSACDPANLYGPALEDGPRMANGEPLTFARIPSTWLVQQRGFPVLLIEDTGSSLQTIQGADEGAASAALTVWLAHLARFASRVSVERWNGESVLNGPGQAVLEAVGFYRDYDGMSWAR